MSDDADVSGDGLWGPTEEAEWANTPCVAGRLATEEDVLEGRAAFFIENPEPGVAPSTDVPIPSLGVQFDEESGAEVLVVVIQAEIVDGECLYGIRYLEGGNGVCTPEEVRLKPA